jgi:three-Cys-motif partner protein
MAIKHYNWEDYSNPPEIAKHSQVKHEMLARYLERYIKVVTSNPHQSSLKLWLIDGFAGGGLYRVADSDLLHHGSPLILLETVNRMCLEIQTADKKYCKNQFNIDARYFFVEKNKPAFNFLQKTLLSEGYKFGSSTSITVINDSFINIFPKIIGEIQRGKQKKPRCIFLLDQYGYKDVPFSILQMIFATFPDTAEVLLTFATESLIQYISKEESFKTAMKNAGLDNVITNELIESFCNTSSYEKKNARLAIEQILATYIKDKSGARFSNPFFITSEISGRSFLLIHLSCHWKARDEMNKIHWELHNYSRHYGFAGLNNFRGIPELVATLGYDAFYDESQAELFESYFDKNAKEKTCEALCNELPEKIHTYQDGIVTVGSLLLENCNYTPANSDHFNETLKKLIDFKVIRVFSSDGKHERLSAKTIRIDDIIERHKQESFYLG